MSTEHILTALRGKPYSGGPIAFISPSGWGNMGDAAIVDSLIHAIRKRRPAAEIVGFTHNSPDTEERHGVRAFTCAGFSLPYQGIRDTPVAQVKDVVSVAAPESTLHRKPLRRIVASVPGIRPAWQMARSVVADHRHGQLTAKRIRGYELVIVAGGGQLDDFWGGAFAHPYTLWKWARLANRVRARFFIMSVGVGTLATPLSRFFVRRTLDLAEYCSFRDQRSFDMCRAMNLSSIANVVPDLAYGVPLSFQTRDRRLARQTLVVAVSPMSWADPRDWPVKDAARYSRYIGTMAELTARIIRAGHQVVLYTTNSSDIRAVGDLHSRLVGTLDQQYHGHLRVATTVTVDAVMRLLADADFAVAARLHGVLLAQVAGCPTLAIAHERKVSTLMEELGHIRFCFDIEEFDAQLAWNGFSSMTETRLDLIDEVQKFVARCRHRVEEQYDRVLGHVG